MILIISHNGGTVNRVIDWIVSINIIVHRINPNLDNVNVRFIELSNKKSEMLLELEAYNITTKLSDYSGIWVWHSNIRFNNCSSFNFKNSDSISSIIKESIQEHHKILVGYFDYFLNNIDNKVIGNYGVQNLNKLSVLLKAKEIGIDIPNSYIVSLKDDVNEILKKQKTVTKPFHEIIYPVFNDTVYQNYTSSVTAETIANSTNHIFPTLVQEEIEKLFEIRAFFLKGKFYSMAIFSQHSDKTKLDFRNYNFDKPNRNVPINLPIEVEKKLRKLFKAFSLNSGSLDMIYSKDNRYVFLEINPVGQFGMVSFPCNYYLEKEIVKNLVNG